MAIFDSVLRERAAGYEIPRCWQYAMEDADLEDYLKWNGARRWPLDNVHLGVTAENQEQADKRIPLLLQVPATVRFVSVEPMLGPVDLTSVSAAYDITVNALMGEWAIEIPPSPGEHDGGIEDALSDHIDLVICGAETGPGARPMKLEWARDLRDQCKEAGVPFFMKRVSGKGPIPDDLMIREFPR